MLAALDRICRTRASVMPWSLATWLAGRKSLAMDLSRAHRAALAAAALAVDAVLPLPAAFTTWGNTSNVLKRWPLAQTRRRLIMPCFAARVSLTSDHAPQVGQIMGFGL